MGTSKSATDSNLAQSFSSGSTKCSISAKVNSLRPIMTSSLSRTSIDVFGQPHAEDPRSRRYFIAKRRTDLGRRKRQLPVVAVEKTFEIDKDSLSRLGTKIPRKTIIRKQMILDPWADPYPTDEPLGPIDVSNIRLNGIGSLRSLPLIGDLVLYFFNFSPNS